MSLLAPQACSPAGQLGANHEIGGGPRSGTAQAAQAAQAACSCELWLAACGGGLFSVMPISCFAELSSVGPACEISVVAAGLWALEGGAGLVTGQVVGLVFSPHFGVSPPP